MSNIPQGREELLLVARCLRSGIVGPKEASTIIRNIVKSRLTREPPVRKAPVRSKAITPALKAQVRAYAARYPQASIAEIAGHFIVNPGRVSEILNGKR